MTIERILGVTVPEARSPLAHVLDALLVEIVVHIGAPAPWPSVLDPDSPDYPFGEALETIAALAFHAGLIETPPDDETNERLFPLGLAIRPTDVDDE